MAFPNKKREMDPPSPPDPKKKGLMIAIGIGKPKMKPPMPPPDDDDEEAGSPDTIMAATAPDAAPSGSVSGAGGKPSDDDNSDAADPRKMEKAGIIRADHHCQNCENWEADTGNCKVLGPGFAPDDACLRYFEEVGDAEPDNDADDAAMAAQGAPAGM